MPDYPYNPQPGDLKFKDLNGDGVINVLDNGLLDIPGYPNLLLVLPLVSTIEILNS